MAAVFEIPHTWEEPEGVLRLLDVIRENNPQANFRKIRYAYYIAEGAHSGQTRRSGEPYITHPLAVAHILAELRMDEDTICAALLHDTLEDCPSITADKLEAQFGKIVVALVEGVTKLKFKRQESLTAREAAAAKSAESAETLRKMLLAMAQDVRVMVIKLADRLHNMRTLDSMAPEKQTRIASETLDIYAPLAARLGIWQMKWQLEDLSFKYLHPAEFVEISELVAKKREVREAELSEAILLLKERLNDRGIREVEVYGRPKHLYSIWNKIVQHGFKFEEILDLLAMRVVVKSQPECYLALGIVHEMWVPIPNLFSDYIAKPKPNGYQSIHTKVVGPHGEPLEIQIRTDEMHQIAEYGVAAHWAYKEGSERAQADTGIITLRQQLFDWSSDNRTSSDYLRSLSTDLFSEQVFVFTPKGDVLDLPRGSTPVDFAFRVHSSLGLTLVGAKINGAIQPLGKQLENGDVVELITRSNAQPSLDWMDLCQSAHTKAKLRTYFRKRNKADNATRGKEALEREMKSLGLDPKDYLGEEALDKLAKQFKDCETGQDVLSRVGEGFISVQSFVQKVRGLNPQPLLPPDHVKVSTSKESKALVVSGSLEGLMIRRGKCCDPLPGEEVVGYVSRGKGIVIHRRMCNNVIAFEQNEPERLTPLEWPATGEFFTSHVKIVAVNRQGLLAEITAVFADAKTNIVGANIRTHANQTAELEVSVDVTDIAHLNFLMTKVSNFSDVISVLRVYERPTEKRR